MSKADQLLRSKLRRPILRPGLVPSQRLFAKIAAGSQGPLTLVTAPAGFGKTTLVAASVAASGVAAAWLSLDPSDNPLERFLSYLIAALRAANPTVGEDAAQILAATQPISPETVLTSLLNDLESVSGDTILVLDDYQVIHNPAVHAALAFLLDHCPPALHLVIATRSDPPLPLVRLRARGQVVELRAADLRFTEAEAAQFLKDGMGLPLSDEAVARLEQRTEGWIAGLQMAALSLRDREDIPAFIAGFSGTNRYILDYLLEEVLAGQEPAVQRFLLCTSILERLSAPLCDAILQDLPEFQGAAHLPSTQALLNLEQNNVFLLPLDEERQWYRYHPLFADLLRQRLNQVFPGLTPQLHLRAAVWLEAAGLPVEAINHALAGGDHDLAASLVEKNTTRLLERGEMGALMSWMEALPGEIRTRRPWLCVHQAYALANAGRLAEVPALLEQAEAAAQQTAAPDQALTGAIAAVRAMTAVMLSQDEAAIGQANRARELLPAGCRWDRSVAAWASGYSLRSQGKLDAASQAFQEQIELGRAMGNIWTLVTGMTDLAQIYRSMGRLKETRRLYETALAEASQQGARSLGYIARMEAGLASVLCEQNELEAAQSLLSAALEHARRWPNPNHLAFVHVIQARLRLAQGASAAAWQAVGEAVRVQESSPITRLLQRQVEATFVRVWLALQSAGVPLDPGGPRVEQAQTLIGTWELAWQNTIPGTRLIAGESEAVVYLALAQAYLVDRQPERAISLLQRLLPEAQALDLIDSTIQAQVLLSLAFDQSGSTAEAAAALLAALALAQAGGYVRVFLDGGTAIQRSLSGLNLAGSPLTQQTYAVRLLSQFAPVESSPATAQGPSAVPTEAPKTASLYLTLVEHLSAREIEVLALLAEGKTNQEIARQLIVAPGTVKAHTASIYRKLDVSNRTEAAARARALGIL